MAKATAKKPPTKTEIVSNIAEATDLTKKQVSAVFEALGSEIKKTIAKKGGPGPVLHSRPVQDHRAAKAGDQGTQGDQSVHRRTDGVQGKAGPECDQDPRPEEPQGHGWLELTRADVVVTPRTDTLPAGSCGSSRRLSSPRGGFPYACAAASGVARCAGRLNCRSALRRIRQAASADADCPDPNLQPGDERLLPQRPPCDSRDRRPQLLERHEQWSGPESNWRHVDFQSTALPTELPDQGRQTLHRRELARKLSIRGDDPRQSPSKETSSGVSTSLTLVPSVGRIRLRNRIRSGHFSALETVVAGVASLIHASMACMALSSAR